MSNFATLNPSAFVKLAHSLEAEVRTASANGTGVDTTGFDHLAAIISIGTTSASDTATFSLEESADDLSYAAISGASVAATASDDYVVGLALRLHGIKKYVRAVYTETATGQSTACSVVLALMGPQSPADQNFTWSASVL